MIVDARIVRIHGDDIDTDVLYPGPFLDIEDPELMKNHLFEGLDPALRDRLGGDTALVVDSNFGSGSSREHVPRAMKASGVKCVVARSFARIFYRNWAGELRPSRCCQRRWRRVRKKVRAEGEIGIHSVMEVKGRKERCSGRCSSRTLVCPPMWSATSWSW